MAKAAAKKPARDTGGTGRFVVKGSGPKQTITTKAGKPLPEIGRDAKSGQFPTISKTRFDAVMKAAENSGLLGEKSARIGGRISPALVKQAKKQTGIETDTDLIEFALANVALEDGFAKTFRKTRGTVDPTLKLGF